VSQTLRSAGAALAVALLSACGVPADDEPRAISQEQQASQDATGGTSDGQTGPASLYLVRFDGTNNHLSPVEVEVPVGSASAPTPATALETLLGETPDQALQDDGYNTAIPANTRLMSPPVLDEEGVLTIDINEPLYRVQAPGSSLAFGQIVCTADAFDEVEAVQFQLEGVVRPAPMGDGESISQPLTCDAYRNLVQPTPEPQ
jgi:spore germination protein GerM